MGTSTPNLSLRKPDPIEVVNVETDINNNMDKIDTAVQDLRVPAKGKLWRTSGFTGPLPAAGALIQFDASRVVGGMSLGAAGDGLIVPVGGLYQVTVCGYATGSNTYRMSFDAHRIRAATANKILCHLLYWKHDGLDYACSLTDEFPLAAGDEIRLNGGASNSIGESWGTDEALGVRLHVEYKGPLSGATPI